MRKFVQRYPHAKVIKLEINYRSTPQILNPANKLISHNIHREQKELKTFNPDGKPIQIFECTTKTQELELVAKKIHDLVN